ncbi:ADP-ribosylglycohydrolase family protein [Blastococcus capsensis]|uniref:ADP-ribosylglycohydrolase family protein n=1 Tax=Blastococcus capsensis TaxID=1564163 RepID=UPI00253FF0DE|nr:ADP-ribosylglycohydrolase family protein [Blastococcus capsensis]MDK3256578.1 ADP-ribosylglycohydrolase family protein [Blastococcus capsensis]
MSRRTGPARGSATEMCGGGPGDREPGEFTDDTQMALLVAASLLERGGLDEADLFDRFHTWAAAGPPNIGTQTRAVLGSGRAWDVAATDHFAATGRAAGNGSLMRTTPAAIWFSRFGTAATMDAARRISALTHGDPSAGEGCAIFSELVRVALEGEDPLAAIPAALEHVAPEHRDRWAAVLAPVCFGMGAIPMRWASAVHGRVLGVGDRVWRGNDLQELSAQLDGKEPVPFEAGVISRIGPTEVLPGIWAGNLDGARHSESDFAVISLCKLGEPFGHEVHRMAYVADTDHNADLDAVLADVLDDLAALRAEDRKVLVHCHGGASRTGLVLRAWLVREQGMSPDEATAHVVERWPHLGLWNQSFTAALERVRRGG